MQKNLFRWLDPIILVGLFISVAVAVGMIRLGNDSVQSLIVGLLSTLVTLLIDLIARIQRTESNLLEAAKFSHIVSDETLSPLLQELAKLYDVIKRYKFETYINIANDNLRESVSQLRNLSAGTATFPSRAIYDYTNEGIRAAKISIKVISPTNEVEYWKSVSGKKYLALNQEAVRRGVRVTRIFAMTYELASQNMDILKEQEKAGVNILVVRPDKVDGENMVIDDKVLIVYHEDLPSQKRLQSIVLETGKVKRAVDAFSYLTEHGRTIKELNTMSVSFRE